jgi:hypothetical protein
VIYLLDTNVLLQLLRRSIGREICQSSHHAVMSPARMPLLARPAMHCCAQVSRPRTRFRPQVSPRLEVASRFDRGDLRSKSRRGRETRAERGRRTGLQARSVSAWLRDVNRHPIATAGRASSGTRLPFYLSFGSAPGRFSCVAFDF